MEQTPRTILNGLLGIIWGFTLSAKGNVIVLAADSVAKSRTVVSREAQ